MTSFDIESWEVELPEKIKVPKIGKFDRASDLPEHLDAYLT